MFYKCIRPLLLTLILCQPINAVTAKEYTIGIAEDGAEILDFYNKVFVGSMGNVVNCVVKTVGIDFVVIKAPHGRLLRLLKHNEIDVISPVVKTSERDRFANFAGPLFPINMRVVFIDTYVDIKSEVFLKHTKKVGFVAKRGTYIDSLIPGALGVDKAELEFIKQEAATWRDALELVRLKRATITIVPESTILASDPNDLQGINSATQLIQNTSFYISVNKPQLTNSFQQATKLCKTTDKQD